MPDNSNSWLGSLVRFHNSGWVYFQECLFCYSRHIQSNILCRYYVYNIVLGHIMLSSEHHKSRRNQAYFVNANQIRDFTKI